jgi:UDP-glucose-4-epimerase GalE
VSSSAKPRVLVTGGAGYIGSHMVKRLWRAGWAVTTVDDLSLGHRDAVKAGELVQADLRDRAAMARLFADRPFDLVMHFAGSSLVGESVAHPRRYYANNMGGSIGLLDAMVDAGVRRIIFSSSCSTYGIPRETPISEDHPQHPVNPYGNTKLLVERALADYSAAYGLSSVALRYFNAAGCDREGDLDERHEPESHLIPLVLREAARVLAGGDREATSLTVFGDDYPTPDGTCVRDYIHVEDLCQAHLLAAERLLSDAGQGGGHPRAPGQGGGHPRAPGGGFEAFNLGNGSGSSVLQVISAARAVTGADFTYRVSGRRPGDPPVLVGSAARATEVLGWRPEIARITDIVATAWRARQSRLHNV